MLLGFADAAYHAVDGVLTAVRNGHGKASGARVPLSAAFTDVPSAVWFRHLVPQF